MMLRLSILCLALGSLAQITPPGCLLENPPTAGDTGPLELQVTAPESAPAGETVELSVNTTGQEEDAGVSYRWYQTYGRVVDLQTATGPTTRFVAPLVATDHTLRFRVDARRSGVAVASAQATVTVIGDPSLAEEETPDQSGDDSSGSEGDSGLGGPAGGSAGGGDSSTDDEPPSTDSGTVRSRVYLLTNKGKIVIILFPIEAPKTVENFRTYIDENFYPGTIFHRVIPDFMIQGGGFLPGMQEKTPTHSAVENESDNGLKNVRASVAMARSDDPDSATSQFFINVVDNPDLDYQDGIPGYTVFGRVVEGMDIVDQIAAVETHSEGGHDDVPVDDILIIRAGYAQ